MDKNKILEDYIGNDMKKIRKICDKIISKTNIPKMYWDDYYDKAVDILLKSMDTYDESKNCKFSTFFYGNLVRRKETWKRDCIRFKRCNLVTDSKGKIMRDKDGNPIVIPDISIHMKVDPDEDYTLEEGISSGFNLEGEIINRLHPTTDKIEMYKSNLSYKQQKAVDLICDGYTQDEIIEELNITEREYKDNILGTMRLYENVKVLLCE